MGTGRTDGGAARTEFGLARSVCGCRGCRLNCEEMPGFLVPADLARLAPPGGDLLAWARAHLRASPGAVVWSSEWGAFRIPTLVPRRAAHGCHRLDPDSGLCRVHADAPFGCAFFSCADGPGPDGKSRAGYRAVLDDIRGPDSLYRRLWLHLAGRGLVARPAEESRRAMAERLAGG